MKLFYLPYVREGLRPGGDGYAAVSWRAQARVTTRVSSPGRPVHDASAHFDLLGPGDVVGIDAAQVLRALPAPDTNRVEPEFFPSLELDAPELPWAYSPAMPASNRLMPWICLIVVEEQAGVSLQPGERGQSPWILNLDPVVAVRELPNLAEAWAWAHVQIVCDDQAQIQDTLANQPDRTLSRLLAPRRLLPQKRYLACVVPTFLAGRVAGLGLDPEPNAAQLGRNLAWGPTDLPPQLPVYFSWRFSTGEAGDVESMLGRLRPAPLRSDATTRLKVRIAGPAGADIVDWQPPLRVHGQVYGDPSPPAVVAALRAALAPAAGDLPVVGPPYLGDAWAPGRALDPPSAWAPMLNLTPMWRAAAGLGAEIIREEQEDLVAAAWQQLAAYKKADRDQRTQQLLNVVENQVKGRLDAAPAEEASRVLGPVVARLSTAAPSVALRSAAGRRVTHKVGRTGPRTAASVAAAPVAAAPAAASAASPGRQSAVALMLGPPPIADKAALLTRLDTSYAGTRFAPRFSAPMSEVVARRFGELFLPAIGQITPDSILALEVERGFIEAFLLGANQELNRELLWRALPADRQATAFRNFWNRTDGNDDIPAITDWPASVALGQNARPMQPGVLLRSEIVRRCPGLLIAAVPALWGPDGKRLPSSDPNAVKLPVIRTRLGDDMVFVGFAGPTLDAMIGQPTPAGPAGWFFLLAENPVDPRFGLDPPTTPVPPVTRANICWSHVNEPADASYARASGFPAVTDAGFAFSFAQSTSASFAFLLQQRPFRAFLHAAALVRPGS